jgi:hypothetical protein
LWAFIFRKINLIPTSGIPDLASFKDNNPLWLEANSLMKFASQSLTSLKVLFWRVGDIVFGKAII